MTLQQYYDKLTRMLKEHPEAADMEVVASIDTDGNAFNPVAYEPAIGYFEEDNFISQNYLSQFEMKEDQVNAICIN